MYNIIDIAKMTGNDLTAEQLNVINNMGNSLLINANPGTGKTTTMIYGIINLVLNKNVVPERILCMSYSREAAKSLQFKYSIIMEKVLGNSASLIKSPEFSTFHSFCLKQEQNPQVISNDADELAIMKSYLTSAGYKYSKETIYDKLFKVFKFITTYGISELSELEDSREYNELIASEEFDANLIMKIYGAFFNYKCGTGFIPQSDMPLIFLDKLIEHPEECEILKNKYDYIIVDEMQDMNLVYMLTLTQFAKNLIAIGDIKQQIYRYNGSDDSIIGLYKYAYPEANILQLTQSFRCDNRIAEYASKIIKPNNYEGFTQFTGKDNHGGVHLIKRKQFYEGLKLMSHKFVERQEWDEYMFLYRFNRTGILAAHELYNYEYAPLYTMEYLSTLYSIYKIDEFNIDKDFLVKINMQNDTLNKIFKDMKERHCTFLNTNVQLNPEETEVMSMIKNIHNTMKLSLIGAYKDIFFDNYYKMFRKVESMFDINEYRGLLDTYKYKTFEEMVCQENEYKTTKKVKVRFPIHYPKFKQIYEFPFLKDIQLIWDIYRNPYNPNAFEAFYNKTKFKVRNRMSPIHKYMSDNCCSYEEAINKCTGISDAESKFYGKLNFVIESMKTNAIQAYIDAFPAFIQAFYDKPDTYMFWNERNIENYTELIVAMYGNKKWSEMLEQEDAKFEHIRETISLDYGIKFKTMHSSKGLEAKKVILLDYTDEAIANKGDLERIEQKDGAMKAVEKLRDERCLLFVGITRAINDVYCVYDKNVPLIDTVQNEVNEYAKYDALYTPKVRRNILLKNKSIRVVVHSKNAEVLGADTTTETSVEEMVQFTDIISKL